MSRFLINTYERLSFQKLFKTGSCDSPKYEVPDIGIFEEFKDKFIVFLHTYAMLKQTMPASLYQSDEIKTSINKAKKQNKSF